MVQATLGVLGGLAFFIGSVVLGRVADCKAYEAATPCGFSTFVGLLYGLAGGLVILAVGLCWAAYTVWKSRRWELPDLAKLTSQERYRLRRSARVMLFNPAGELLLIRFAAQREEDEKFIFWVTPGGEIEPAEESRAAAERELYEELGLRLPLVGPVHEESGGTYTHLGETVRNEDVFYAAMCAKEQPKLAGITADEIALMQEMRWWTLEELAQCQDKVYPEALAAVAGEVWKRCRVALESL